MHLIFVRHGETDANLDGKLMGGNSGPPLNVTGRAQATRVAAALEESIPFHLYTSPAQRAKETAVIISNTLNIGFTVEDSLSEIDIGHLEGLTNAEVSREYPSYSTAWERDSATARPPGGETMQELQDRAWATVQRLSAQHTDGSVVAVSHLFTILSVVSKVFEMPLRHFLRIRLDLGAMIRIEFTPDKSEVISINETWHLK